VVCCPSTSYFFICLYARFGDKLVYYDVSKRNLMNGGLGHTSTIFFLLSFLVFIFFINFDF
jgi:hypothetical protein